MLPHWAVGFRHKNTEGDTNIQSIAMGYKGDLLYLKLLQLYINIFEMLLESNSN